MLGTRLAPALRAFKYRNFQLFFGGQFISITGTYMQSVAQAWLVYRLTGSAVLLGLVAFSTQISVFVLAPISGAIADRKDRHTILIATQSAAMLLSFVLAALTLTGRVEIWHVFTIAALLGVINAFDFPTRQAFVADLVAKDDLRSAITLNSSMINSARVIGPAIAGLLIAAMGEGWCFFANAVSYIAVLIGLMLMKLEPHRHTVRTESMRADIIEAFRFVQHTGPVGALLLLLGLMSLMGMRFDVLLPIFAQKTLGGGPREFGLLMGASGIGAILGSLSLAAFGKDKNLGDWVGVSSAMFGGSLILFSVSHTLLPSLGWMLLVGFSMVAQLDSSNTLVQEIVADELRGRVMAIWTMMLTGLAPFGSLLSGLLAQNFGAPRTLAAGGVSCVMGAVAFGFCLPILKREARKLKMKHHRGDGHKADKQSS